MTRLPAVSPGQIFTGSLFNEPVRVGTVQANGPTGWVVGLVGTQSERFRKVTLTAADLDRLSIIDAQHSFGGDGRLLRLASVLALPHPEREAPEVRRLRPNFETEASAMRVVMEHERAQGRQVYDVSEKNLGYDLCFWLYVVTDCDNAPRLQEPIRDPARLYWNEVTKVAHYYLAVDAMTKPMQVREDQPPYGREKS